MIAFFQKLVNKIISNKNRTALIAIYAVVFIILTNINLVISQELNMGNYSKSDNLNVKTYLEFKELLDKDQVVAVEMHNVSNNILFETKEGDIFETTNPKTDDFRLLILEKGIDLKEPETINSNYVKDSLIQKRQEGGMNHYSRLKLINIVIQFILMTMILIIPIIYFYKKFAESDISETVMPSEEGNKERKVTLDSVEGLDEVKDDIKLIIDSLKQPKIYEEIGARVPTGIILYGPPGTGKTLTAKAIASEAGVPFFSVSGSDFVEKYVGVGARRVRDLYSQARRNSPCIVFIDEIDAVGKSRGMDENSERDQTINALLTELDGFDGSEGIITIAATNRIEMLDDALIRPGRFDKHLAIPLPDKESRYKILKLHASNKKLSEDICLNELSRITVGFSGAGLESLLNEAAIIALKNKDTVITKEDLDNAFYKILMKGNKKESSYSRPKEEIELVAWHEAGHALLTKLLTEDEVTKVTILASTSGAGGVTFTTPEDMGLYSKEYIESKIAIMYAGRIAEYLLLGDQNKVTTGASNDIEQATSLIKTYINNYGMSSELGLINLDVLFGNQASQLGANEKILDEASQISKSIYQKAYNILLENKCILEDIALSLIEEESLNNAELDQIINKYKK